MRAGRRISRSEVRHGTADGGTLGDALGPKDAVQFYRLDPRRLRDATCGDVFAAVHLAFLAGIAAAHAAPAGRVIGQDEHGRWMGDDGAPGLILAVLSQAFARRIGPWRSQANDAG